jgi:hypothetical protein
MTATDKRVLAWVMLFLAVIMLSPCCCGIVVYHARHNRHAMANMKYVTFGMTMDQVEEIVGPPDKIVDERGWGAVWLYNNAFSEHAIYFNKEHRVGWKHPYER